ncbi:hypothetical protein SCHIN_v1c00850 [Spiroplasma chinense]|uniref:Uncharacterized protein n=1 Tax=Spiroplasma chinense TaxID=216932 RepID=A0A5B9Y3E9_9MOLU|nr:hypothetical protein [Spiroplasma chinense]QEH61283.1 hypothetical protein SCHIN_v1c00850 [Spiroplasma chinense]
MRKINIPKNVFKMAKINLKMVTLSKINFAFLGVILFVNFAFSGIYIFLNFNRTNNADYSYVFAIENACILFLFSLFSIYCTSRIYFSTENKSYQLLERQYGLKGWVSFFVRYFLIFVYLLTIVFIYFLLQTMLTQINGVKISFPLISAPKLNLILYSILVLNVFILLTLIVKSLAGLFLTTLYILSLIFGPIVTAALKDDSHPQNQRVVEELTFKINIGKQFVKYSEKDKLNLYDGSYEQLFMWYEDEYYFKDFNLMSNLSSFYPYQGSNVVDAIIYNDEPLNFYLAFWMGQTLNRNENNKYLLGFSDKLLQAHLDLKTSIESIERKTNVTWSQLPYYEWVEDEKYVPINFKKTLKQLRKTTFGKNYKNLLQFIELNLDDLLNYRDPFSDRYPLFFSTRFIGGSVIDTPKKNELWEKYINNTNEEVNDFYKAYPEFLVISQVLNIGLMNSYAIYTGALNFFENNSLQFFSLDYYDKTLSKIKSRSYANYFNYSSYLNTSYYNGIYSNAYLNQTYQFWWLEPKNYYVLNDDLLISNWKNNSLSTKSSVLKNDLKLKNTQIVIFAYALFIAQASLTLLISFVIYNRRNIEI